jgi:hypothetical protein
VLVLDVKTRLDTVGDHARPIAVRRGRRSARDAQRKEEADSIGSAEIQILADDGVEEMAALDWAIEDLRQTHFQLADGDVPRWGTLFLSTTSMMMPPHVTGTSFVLPAATSTGTDII